MEKIEHKLDALKKSIDTLVLLELAKAGANKDQARKVLGALDNTEFGKVKSLFSERKSKK